MQVLDIEQGTDLWFEARSKIPTASCASKVMAKGQGKTRLSYMYQLIGEVVTGEPASKWPGNDHTERGHADEPIAIELYQRRTGLTVDPCGFIRNHDGIGGAGYSPDGLVGDRGAIECKSRLAHIQAELLDTGKVPRDAMLQIQFGLWVCERDWCDYVSYCKGMPLFVKRVESDATIQAEIAAEVERFHKDINAKLEKLAELG